VRQLVDALSDLVGDEAAAAKRISDVLRYQVRLGRVRRVERGAYEVVPGAMPKATAWRCVNWRREQQRWWQEQAGGLA
jgi:hypothetical protein